MVRVIAPDNNSNSLGSGTLIHVTDTHGLVLTNWHVVRDAKGPVEVVFPNGFRSGGKVMKVDKDWDLAAIGIWRPDVEPVELSTRPPQKGEVLTIAGYGSGSYRAASGRCLQYLSPGDGHPFEIVELGTEARQGDSGGPIFNQQGQLAGVLLGAARGRTVGSFCGRVGNFIANVTPVLDHQGKEMIADAKSNTSSEIDRRLAATERGRTGLPSPGGSQVPHHPQGQSASDPLAARPTQPKSTPNHDPFQAHKNREPRVAAAREPVRSDMTALGPLPANAADQLVQFDDERSREDEDFVQPWTPSMGSAPQRRLVADRRSDWNSSSTGRRGAAVLYTDGGRGLSTDGSGGIASRGRGGRGLQGAPNPQESKTAGEGFNLQAVVGTTPIEQGKTFLAIFGLASLLVFSLRSMWS